MLPSLTLSQSARLEGDLIVGESSELADGTEDESGNSANSPGVGPLIRTDLRRYGAETPGSGAQCF